MIGKRHERRDDPNGEEGLDSFPTVHGTEMTTILLEASGDAGKPNIQEIADALSAGSVLPTPISLQTTVCFYDTTKLALTYQWLTILYLDTTSGWHLYTEKIPNLFNEGPLHIYIKSTLDQSIPRHPPAQFNDALAGRIFNEMLRPIFCITKKSEQVYIRFKGNRIFVGALQLEAYNHTSSKLIWSDDLLYLTCDYRILEDISTELNNTIIKTNYHLLPLDTLPKNAIDSSFNKPIWQLINKLWSDPLLVQVIKDKRLDNNTHSKDYYILQELRSTLRAFKQLPKNLIEPLPVTQRKVTYRKGLTKQGQSGDLYPTYPTKADHFDDRKGRYKGHDPSISDVLESALATAALTFLANDIGVLYDTNPEHLHKCRVSLRRIRSTARLLKVSGYTAPIRSSLSTLRWYGRQLGAVRDIDVLITHLQEDRETIAAEVDGAFDQIVLPFQHTRENLLRALRRARNSDRFLELLEILWTLAMIHSRTETQGPIGYNPGVSDHWNSQEDDAFELPVRIDRVLSAAWHELEHLAKGLSANSADNELHNLRIATKRFRYLLEACAPLTALDMKKIIKIATKLQDSLGEQHDSVVARAHLAEAAKEYGLDPATASLARLLHRQEEKRDLSARKRWPSIFHDLQVTWEQMRV